MKSKKPISLLDSKLQKPATTSAPIPKLLKVKSSDLILSEQLDQISRHFEIGASPVTSGAITEGGLVEYSLYHPLLLGKPSAKKRPGRFQIIGNVETYFFAQQHPNIKVTGILFDHLRPLKAAVLLNVLIPLVEGRDGRLRKELKRQASDVFSSSNPVFVALRELLENYFDVKDRKSLAALFLSDPRPATAAANAPLLQTIREQGA